MSKLFLMAGTKGGIGKTLVATLLADLSADAGYRSVLFDCDEENKSLFHAMSGRKVDQILERYSLEAEFGNDNFPLDRVLNRLFEIEQNKEHYPGENVFVIDLKAGSTCKMLEWMKLFPFPMLPELNVELYIVGIVTGDPDSLMTYLPWLKEFEVRAGQGLVRFLTILNQVDGNGREQFQRYLKPYLEKKLPDAPVIPLENLSRGYMTLIRAAGTSYGQIGREGAPQIPELGFMGTYRIQNEFEKIRQRFASLLPPAVETVGEHE